MSFKKRLRSRFGATETFAIVSQVGMATATIETFTAWITVSNAAKTGLLNRRVFNGKGAKNKRVLYG